MTAEPSRRLPALLRLAALVVAFVVAAVALQLSGWDGPEQLRSSVEDAGAWGPVLYVIGYAALVLVPTPASVLTILGGLSVLLRAIVVLRRPDLLADPFGGEEAEPS